ncbi:MAG: signal peptide peptidase SppA [Bacteroidia bacterium]
MKQFFGAFFGSILGIIISTIIAVLIIVAAISSSFKDAFKSTDEFKFKQKGNSVYHLEFNGSIIDRDLKDPFSQIDFGSFGGNKGLGLNMLLESIEKAEADTSIKGIYMDFKSLSAGQAIVEELRKGLEKFKKSGKWIIAYSEGYSHGTYYLASVADKVYLNPQGGMEWKGLSMQMMFFKKTLEKLGVDVEIYRHGKFKSAVEPFMLEKMSEANRLQAETFLNSIWNNMVNDIAKSRKMESAKLQELANNLAIVFPEDAVNNGLVDELKYEDEVMAEIMSRVKVKEAKKLNLVSIKNYKKYKPKKKNKSKNEIAVIYAIGQINSGEGGDDEIGSIRIAKAIKDAREDKDIKAIVMRVNSPGGSALASDVIWREVTLAKKVKPFVVSMGDVAASGGYYISCAADKIFAEPNTITGSIGVFGVVPNFRKVYEEKLGITLDTVNTNKHSDMMSTMRGATPTESVFIQKSVEAIYDVFITKVSKGRGMTKEGVDSIGQGRVWSGSDALNIGLVDELGGLNEAIAFAASKAKLKDYKLKDLPKQKNPFEDLFGSMEMEAESKMLKRNLGQHYSILKKAQSLQGMKGVQMRLPYLMEIY